MQCALSFCVGITARPTREDVAGTRTQVCYFACVVGSQGELRSEPVRRADGFTAAAQSLNERGFRTREGKPWTPTVIFEMMPRLVEVAADILTSDEWEALRQRM
jgi:pantothenate kinase